MYARHDGFLGSGRAASRLHTSLVQNHVDSNMVVLSKTSADERVSGVPFSRRLFASVRHSPKLLQELPLLLIPFLAPRRACLVDLFTMNSFSKLSIPKNQFDADIVHLHLMCRNYLSVEELKKITVPIVWTHHDMSAFTGGCHYTYNVQCERYQTGCGECPILGSCKKNDISHSNIERKKRAWSDINFHMVTPSRWLAECLKNSFLFHDRHVDVIPYGLDLESFRPYDKDEARSYWKLSSSKPVILFGALYASLNRRKGFHELIASLKLLKNLWKEDAQVVFFGSQAPMRSLDLPFETTWLGHISGVDKLAMLYSAADVFAIPTLQDNLPNMVLESLACGCPVVGFRVGGVPDMVDHKQTGYIAEPYEPASLAEGINWVLELNDSDRIAMSAKARARAVRDYSFDVQAKAYIALYQKILGQPMVK